MRSLHLNKERHLFNSLFHSWERLGRPRVPTKLRENWGYVLIMHQCNNVTQCNNSPMHQCNNEDCGHKQSSQIGICRKTMSRDDDFKDRIIALPYYVMNAIKSNLSLFDAIKVNPTLSASGNWNSLSLSLNYHGMSLTQYWLHPNSHIGFGVLAT